jgi:hypothetical protein
MERTLERIASAPPDSIPGGPGDGRHVVDTDGAEEVIARGRPAFAGRVEGEVGSGEIILAS